MNTFEALKAYADAHEIKYPTNIGEKTLQAKCDAYQAENEPPIDESAPAPLTVPVTIEKETTLKYDEPAPPKLATKPKPPALAEAKTLGKKKKQKEIWLAHHT